tara:strand:- start:3787 stop:4071 length:285 start_codon:yes stop_codon:yes gene_type:complete
MSESIKALEALRDALPSDTASNTRNWITRAIAALEAGESKPRNGTNGRNCGFKYSEHAHGGYGLNPRTAATLKRLVEREKVAAALALLEKGGEG